MLSMYLSALEGTSFKKNDRFISASTSNCEMEGKANQSI